MSAERTNCCRATKPRVALSLLEAVASHECHQQVFVCDGGAASEVGGWRKTTRRGETGSEFEVPGQDCGVVSATTDLEAERAPYYSVCWRAVR